MIIGINSGKPNSAAFPGSSASSNFGLQVGIPDDEENVNVITSSFSSAVTDDLPSPSSSPDAALTQFQIKSSLLSSQDMEGFLPSITAASIHNRASSREARSSHQNSRK